MVRGTNLPTVPQTVPSLCLSILDTASESGWFHIPLVLHPIFSSAIQFDLIRYTLLPALTQLSGCMSEDCIRHFLTTWRPLIFVCLHSNIFVFLLSYHLLQQSIYDSKWKSHHVNHYYPEDSIPIKLVPILESVFSIILCPGLVVLALRVFWSMMS